MRDCRVTERTVGQLLESISGRPYCWDDPCVARDATVAYQADAAQAAIAALLRRWHA